jgi:hypothetical protein
MVGALERGDEPDRVLPLLGLPLLEDGDDAEDDRDEDRRRRLVDVTAGAQEEEAGERQQRRGGRLRHQPQRLPGQPPTDALPAEPGRQPVPHEAGIHGRMCPRIPRR